MNLLLELLFLPRADLYRKQMISCNFLKLSFAKINCYHKSEVITTCGRTLLLLCIVQPFKKVDGWINNELRNLHDLKSDYFSLPIRSAWLLAWWLRIHSTSTHRRVGKYIAHFRTNTNRTALLARYTISWDTRWRRASWEWH